MYDPMSWHDVLLAKPKRRNVYIILAHQYVASVLNGLNGADVSAISQELAEARDLLYFKNPDSDLDYLHKDFVRLADTLDRFNNGVIGPGSCP